MNTKCPRCRFKFELSAPSDGGVVAGVCPRCGHQFEVETPATITAEQSHPEPAAPATYIQQPSDMAQQMPQPQQAEAPVQKDYDESAQQQVTYVVQQPNNTTRNILIATVVALTLIAGGLFLFQYLQQNNASQLPDNTFATDTVAEQPSETSSATNAKISDGYYRLSGNIGGSTINGNITVSGGSINGEYGYNGRSSGLELYGSIDDDGSVSVSEFNDDYNSGNYRGRVASTWIIEGTFTNSKGSSFGYQWNLTKLSDIENDEPGPSYEETPQYVVVDGVNVRVRTTPDINDYNIITDSYGNNLHPDKGQHLDYLGEEGDFYLVRFNGNSVYISKKHSYVAY